MKYDFYADAGHGWLKVNRAELETLKIADKISSFSYQNGDAVYLEEDMDLGTFARAKGWTPQTCGQHITDHYHGNFSRIRNFGSYSHDQS